ncbi:hypothetical protein [Demequina litorisediminis]|uniref:hypothetical protein n=1 Tax=Demequina litorisediminis TaxID=1849022 RepID=UPI0024E168BF|nr:hypothetical protein [Demequina litorisediminis]
MTSLRPVMLAKAEQVSRLAPASRCVDLAVIVGAESLALAELVPTLARAKQVVVVGDAHSATRSAVAAMAAMLPSVTMHATPQPRDPRVSALLAEVAYGRALPTQPAARGQGRLDVTVIDATGVPVAGTDVVESTAAEVQAVVAHVARAYDSAPRSDLLVVAGNEPSCRAPARRPPRARRTPRRGSRRGVGRRWRPPRPRGDRDAWLRRRRRQPRAGAPRGSYSGVGPRVAGSGALLGQSRCHRLHDARRGLARGHRR